MSTSVEVSTKEPELKLDRSQPSFADMMALAETLLKTGFLPEAVKTPGQALAIILTGQEMGIGPMQSLRSIGVIRGRPVVAADLQLALFKRAGGKSKWEVNEATKVSLWLRHANGDEHTQSFTMEDAQRAKLTERGDTYQKFPQAMLRARAITAGLKAVGFEPTAGVYDPAELASVLPSAAQLRELPEMAVEGETEEIVPSASHGPKSAISWPFGTKKGTPLADLSTEDLRAALAWIRKTHKGEDLVQPIVDVLTERMGEQPEPAA